MESETPTEEDRAYAIAMLRKWFFTSISPTEDPDSIDGLSNGTHRHLFNVYLPAVLREDDSERPPTDDSLTLSQFFASFLASALARQCVSKACRTLKLAPDQRDALPEVHPRVRFFMHLAHAMDTPTASGLPIAETDLGERCEIHLSGQAHLSHISPPFLRVREDGSPVEEDDDGEEHWQGLAKNMCEVTLMVGGVIGAFKSASVPVGLGVQCRVCASPFHLVEDLRGLNIDAGKCIDDPCDMPNELVQLLAGVKCGECGYCFSALHPLSTLYITGIRKRAGSDPPSDE